VQANADEAVGEARAVVAERHLVRDGTPRVEHRAAAE